MSDQIISIRFLSFEGFSNMRFAFAEMGRSFVQKWQSNGLSFAKHLGVGAGNGFSIWPDFSSYAFLGVFDNQAASDHFFTSNQRWLTLSSHASATKGWDAVAIKGHGAWNGSNPFSIVEDPGNGPLLVMTRASIVWYKSPIFWFYVSHASKYLENRAGLLFAKAEGVLPAPEANHAIAQVIREANEATAIGEERVILFNLCGHGHFDLTAYDDFIQGKLQDHVLDEEALQASALGVLAV